MEPDQRVLKSYVWHGSDCFFVSTIKRDSSAMVFPAPRYFETIAWTFDYDSKTRRDQVAMVGDGPAFAQHMSVCEQLFRNGRYEKVE